jgi:hypothetical protein
LLPERAAMLRYTYCLACSSVETLRAVTFIVFTRVSQ